jgi:alkylhydroperoxidase family enzyme
VEKLTVAPTSIVESDVESLRRVGLDDRMIHDVAAVASYFAFVNRLADGLGVEPESHRDVE